MPHVDELTLLLADRALCGAGALLLAAILLRWVRSEAWRNPLGPIAPPDNPPTLLHLVGVFAAFWIVSVILLAAARIDTQAARASGSPEWLTFNGIDGGAKLFASVLMAVILHQHPAFRRKTPSARDPFGMLRVSIVAVLVILPIADLQLRTGQLVWRWLDPTTTQPVHGALEALTDSAWGASGTVLLASTAIVVAPVAEELFFRGLLLQTLWGYLGHAWLAILLSGMAFGFIHNQQPQDVLPLITMGVILGYVRVRYRSLAACILIHALFNARTIVFALLNPELVGSG